MRPEEKKIVDKPGKKIPMKEQMKVVGGPTPQAHNLAHSIGGIKLLKLAKKHSIDTSGSDAVLAQRLIDKGII